MSKPHCRFYKLFQTIVLILSALVCIALLFFVCNPLFQDDRLPGICAGLSLSDHIQLEPEQLEKEALELLDLNTVSSDTCTAEFPLPKDWKLYQSEAVVKAAGFKSRLLKDSLFLRSFDYVHLMNDMDLPGDEPVLFHLNVKGFGNIMPLLSCYTEDFAYEKEWIMPPQKVLSFIPQDLYFLYRPPVSGRLRFRVGLRSKGFFSVRSCSVLTLQDKILQGTTVVEGVLASEPDAGKRIAEVELTSVFRGASLPKRILVSFPQETDMLDLKTGDLMHLWLQPPYPLSSGKTLPFCKSVRFKKLDHSSRMYSDLVPFSAECSTLELTQPRKQEQDFSWELELFSRRLKQFEENSEMIHSVYNRAANERRNSSKRENGFFSWRSENGPIYSLPDTFDFLKMASLPQDQLDALIALNRFLAEKGIHLIVLPFPNHHTVAAMALDPQLAAWGDRRTIAFTHTLLKNGIDTLYFTDELIKKQTGRQIYFLYPNDPHPFQDLYEILVPLLAEKIRSLLGKDDVPQFRKEDFSHGPKKASLYSAPFPISSGAYHGGKIPYYEILYKGEPYAVNSPRSPILLAGNSFCNSPHPRSLSAMLTEKLLIPVENLINLGNGPLSSVPQELLNNPVRCLYGKKIVILAAATDMFLESTIINVDEVRREMDVMSRSQVVFSPDMPGKDWPEMDRNIFPCTNLFQQYLANRNVKMLIPFPIHGNNVKTLFRFPIPENLRGKTGLFLHAEFIPYKENVYQIRINGKSFALPIPGFSSFQTFSLNVPIRREDHEIHAEAVFQNNRNGLLGIGKIEIRQER